MKKKISWKLILAAAGVLASAAFYIQSSGMEAEEQENSVIISGAGAAGTEAESPGGSPAQAGAAGTEAAAGTEGAGGMQAQVSGDSAAGSCGEAGGGGFTEQQKAELREIAETCLEEKTETLIEEALRQALEEQMKSLAESGKLAEAAAAYAEHQSSLVNINTADQAELETLTGIGETRAAAILAWRKANGNFQSVEELLKVKGITEKILAGLREEVTV